MGPRTRQHPCAFQSQLATCSQAWAAVLLSQGNVSLWAQALTKDVGTKWTNEAVAVLQGFQTKCSWIDVDLTGGKHV